MIKLIVYAVIIGAVIYFGSTVKLGKRTFFGHVRAIWHTEEVQDLKDGVEEKAKPAVERVKRGIEAAASDGDTKWVTLEVLDIAAEIPSCASAVVASGEARLKSSDAASCPRFEIYVTKESARTVDAEVADLDHVFVPKPRIVRKETTANGWAIEIDHDGRRLYEQVAVDGRTFLCASTSGDISIVRRVCDSLRAHAP